MSKKSPPYLLPKNFPPHAPLPPGGPWIRPEDAEREVAEQLQLARHAPSVPMAPLVAASEQDWEDEPTQELAPIGTGERHPSWRAREAMDTLVDADSDDARDTEHPPSPSPDASSWPNTDRMDQVDHQPDESPAQSAEEAPSGPRSSDAHPLTLGIGLAPGLTPLAMVESQAAQRRKRSA